MAENSGIEPGDVIYATDKPRKLVVHNVKDGIVYGADWQTDVDPTVRGEDGIPKAAVGLFQFPVATIEDEIAAGKATLTKGPQ